MRAIFCLLLAPTLALGAVPSEAPSPPPEEIVQMWVDKADYSPSAKTLEIVLRAEIAESWHINAHEPSLDTLIPTTLTVMPPEGFVVGEIQYPEPTELPFAFAGGRRLKVYHREVSFRIPLSLGRELPPEGVSFETRLRFQACDDTRCLRPAMAERTFIVRSPPIPGISPSATTLSATAFATPVERWLSEKSLLVTLLLVAFMGLGLNLTPCVYPLISVTLAYFGSQSRDRRGRAFVLALSYALGIALTFSVLGVSAALSGSLFGRALQHPMTLVFVAAVMIALALASFGVYRFQPPAWLLQRVGGASLGLTGALLMGLTMGIVAAPCVGPIIVGLLLAVGTRGDPWLGFLLFFALATGLAAPYVALATAAGSITKLPRSGDWLVWVEHVFGFLLIGMALYFASPLLPDRAVGLLLPAFLGIAGLYLGFLDSSGSALRYFPIARQTFGVLVLATAVWAGLPAPAGSSISWTEFSPATLETAREKSRPAVVDFRADWCLPCIEMEQTTFVDPQVASRSREFAMLRADVTEDSEANEGLLKRYEILGVPTTIFYDSTGKEYRRLVGYISPKEFVSLLEKTRGAGRVDEARR